MRDLGPADPEQVLGDQASGGGVVDDDEQSLSSADGVNAYTMGTSRAPANGGGD